MVKPATEILCRFFLPKTGTERRSASKILEDQMNSDAQPPSSYHHRTSPKRLIWCFVLLANLFVLDIGFFANRWNRPLNVSGEAIELPAQSGKVLIVGGDNQNGIVSQSEIFDPVSKPLL